MTNKINTSELEANLSQSLTIDKLQVWETAEFDRSNALGWLKLVCVQQQRQIEMLAGIVAQLAPDLYLSAKLVGIEGLPDVPDSPGEGENHGTH